MFRSVGSAVVRASARQSAAAAAVRSSSTFGRTLPRQMATHVVEVPSMGDSITEGTLISWEKSPGEAVEQDEVLAVIETDKVNVDVRAPYSGVLTEVFASVDEDVAVGASLLKIDTEATATATAAPAAAAPAPTPVEAAPAAPAAAAVAAAAAPVSGGRKPSIQFLGKGGWAARRDPTTASSTATAAAAAAPIMMEIVQHTVGAVDFWELPAGAMHGRPVISDLEMDAVDTGGAELVA